eukprot:CAMPEP_0176343618 /NCGR_PEP_ID=MMETSP0126-20121128/4082_1 /TAXON_ID=141414 ORGANISM="Strombidinopsis acuminatum, Strain SPMC142" /NCGR_SAMPLE_ID=MMETSP0126 /ASSEMBLY_ACC=CAM_ASM_000229 /LENGTH=68 /DNA_ID=CAMNT_0017689663 /DNA_START=2881 /DNA_END=3087 /DNA_ORIENTATION=+
MFFIIAESIHQACLRVKRWRLMRKYAKTRGEQILHMEKKVRERNFKRQSRNDKAKEKLKNLSKQKSHM